MTRPVPSFSPAQAAAWDRVAGALAEAFLVFHARTLAGVLPAAVLAVVLLVALSPGFRARNVAAPADGDTPA